jgi:hypothetical protein
MPKFTWFLILCISLFLSACSSSGTSPTEPSPENIINLTNQDAGISTQHTELLGFYDISIDPETGEAEISLGRTAMFTLNIVTYLNLNPQNVAIKLNSVTPGPIYNEIDVDLTYKHPLPNQPNFDLYDVRGVLITVGAQAMGHNASLQYGQLGNGMYVANADGYTRWFNITEFTTTPGFLSYTKGTYATNGYNGNATLNPYKYYADGLTSKGNLWDFLTTTANNGKFASGAVNSRNYILRIPVGTPIKLAYSVLADWNGPVQPANAPEALVCNAVVTPDVWFVDPTLKGGNVIVDISLFDWSSTYVSGPMTDYSIIIESTVLSTPYQLNASEMTPTGGSGQAWTYHISIPGDNITGVAGNEFWVNVIYPGFDYTNTFGVINAAWADQLTASFRYDLPVSPFQPVPPVVDSGVTGEIAPFLNSVYPYTVIAHDDNGDILHYSWTVTDEATMTELITASPGNGDGIINIDFGAFNPVEGQIFLIDCDVTDGKFTTSATQLSVAAQVPANGWARTWGGTADDYGSSIAIDPDGNVYVAGSFQGTVDLNPSFGVDEHTSNGSYDIFLCKFSMHGNFLWARTWGGGTDDWANGLAFDLDGNPYIAGHFTGSADFDPGAGQDIHSSLGFYDSYITKLDSDGNFLWARTWGSTGYDQCYGGVTTDSLGNPVMTGQFNYTVDFDPGVAVFNLTSKAGWDPWLSKLDINGNFVWARSWGGHSDDGGASVILDASDNVFASGQFGGLVDFDPGAPVVNRSSNGSKDAYLSKFDSAGNFQWVQTWGGMSADYAYSLAIDSTGNPYVGGFFASGADFDPGAGNDPHYSNGGFDAFLSKFDTNGTFQWARTWGGAGDDEAYHLTFDTMDNAHLTGFFAWDVDFDPGVGTDIHTAIGGIDVFLTKLDSSGNLVWARTWGSTSTERGYSVATNSTNNAYITGIFTDVADFNPGVVIDEHTSNGGYDIFLSKALPDGSW